MTEVWLEMAEEHLLANDVIMAYRTAKTALQLDPFFGSVDKYVAAYRVHAAALRKNPDGEIDWYNVLGIDDYSTPTEDITHLFCKTFKLIHPDDHCSAAAKGAHELLVKAFEVICDKESRIAFHKRWNLPLVFRNSKSCSDKHPVRSLKFNRYSCSNKTLKI